VKELKKPQKGAPHFPVLRLTGGPHSADLEASLDGEEIQRVHRIEITTDVNDVVRIKTYQMVEVELELAGEVEDAGWIASVYLVVVERVMGNGKVKRRVPLAKGMGPTQPDALRDAIVAITSLEEPGGPVQ
jgi:hypothetical protein